MHFPNQSIVYKAFEDLRQNHAEVSFRRHLMTSSSRLATTCSFVRWPQLRQVVSHCNVDRWRSRRQNLRKVPPSLPPPTLRCSSWLVVKDGYTPEMGGAGSKKLPKEDMDFLMQNTNFTKQQIKAWYSGFMVRNGATWALHRQWLICIQINVHCPTHSFGTENECSVCQKPVVRSDSPNPTFSTFSFGIYRRAKSRPVRVLNPQPTNRAQLELLWEWHEYVLQWMDWDVYVEKLFHRQKIQISFSNIWRRNILSW